MERYESYKDSGVQWLGEIPSHWEVKHLRNFLTIFSEKGHGDKQLLSVTREKGVILRDKDNKEENHNFVPDDLSGYKHLCAGDFVINKMKSWQGSYGVSEYEGIVSPAYFTCKLRGVNPKFFSRAIRSKAYIGFFMQYSKGIRVDQWDLDPNSMKEIPFVLPPLPEQQAIAAYLDTMTSKIDAAIAQQQKMIDLLNERKQIIINNAVTKGLNPNVKMKDSGVDWIGEIPEHWEVKKFKAIASVKSNLVHPSDYLLYKQIAPDNIEKDTGKIVNVKTVQEAGVISDNHLFFKGQILYSKIRPNLNKVAIAPYDGLCSADMYPIETIVDILFLQVFMLSKVFTNQVTSVVMDRVKMPKINKEELGKILILCPPDDEQKKIVNAINEICVPINRSILNIEKQIELLQERKQILINEVVTGKVKVCNN